jgi:hypothetical protein
MNTLKSMLKWFSGATAVMMGLVCMVYAPVVATLSIAIGLILIPSSLKVLEQKINYTFSKQVKWIVAIIGLFVTGSLASTYEAFRDKEGDRMVEEATVLIDDGDLDGAKAKIEEAKVKYNTPDNKATALEREIEQSASLDFAKEQLVELTDDELEKLQSGALDKTILVQKTLNSNLIGLMKELAPERDKIVTEIQAKREEERVAAELRKQEELNKNREETIKRQFSSWDGSHRTLTKFIKDNMNDPDSYEHIETRYRDDGNSIIVITRFRGANAFGGKVINTITARVGIDGNVIEVIGDDY